MFTFSDNIFIFTVSLTNVTLHLVITYSHLHWVITSTFFPYLITSIISLSSLLPSPDIPLLISFPPNTFLVILSHLSSPLLSTLLYSTLLIGFPPLSSPLLPVLQFFLSKVKLLPLLSAGPPMGDLYVEAGSGPIVSRLAWRFTHNYHLHPTCEVHYTPNWIWYEKISQNNLTGRISLNLLHR